MSVYGLGHHHRRAESRSCFWASLSPTVGTTMKIYWKSWRRFGASFSPDVPPCWQRAGSGNWPWGAASCLGGSWSRLATLKSQLQPGDAVPRPPRESGWRGQRAQRGWVGVLPGSLMWSQLRCICPCNALTQDDASGSTERSEMVKSTIGYFFWFFWFFFFFFLPKSTCFCEVFQNFFDRLALSVDRFTISFTQSLQGHPALYLQPTRPLVLHLSSPQEQSPSPLWFTYAEELINLSDCHYPCGISCFYVLVPFSFTFATVISGHSRHVVKGCWYFPHSFSGSLENCSCDGKQS